MLLDSLLLFAVFEFRLGKCLGHPGVVQPQAMRIHVNVSAYADTNLTQLQQSHNQTFIVRAPVSVATPPPTLSPPPEVVLATSSPAPNNDVSAYPVSKEDMHQAVLRMATSLKIIGANPNADEGVLKGVICDITSRHLNGVEANSSSSLIQDYVMHVLSASEASRLSEDQTKSVLSKGLKGSLSEVVGVMTSCGAPLRSISKFLLSLSMEETRMKIILDSFNEGPRSGVTLEALDEMQEIVLLLMSKNVLGGVTEAIVNKIRAEVFFIALKRIMPTTFVESFENKGYSMDEIVKRLLEEESNKALSEIFSLNSRNGHNFRSTRDIKGTKSLSSRKGGTNVDKKEDVSDLVHLHVGSALSKDEQSKDKSAATTTTTTAKTTTTRKISDSDSWSLESYADNDDDSYYDGWESSSSESHEVKESSTKKSTATSPAIVIQGRSSRTKKQQHQQHHNTYSGEYVDIQAYMENYGFDSDGDKDDDDEEDEEYDLEGDEEEEEEEMSASEEIMSKESLHRSAVREIISDSTEESEKLDELYDKLVDMGHIPG